jgi:AcrR family transcriptional regulator
LKRRARSKQRDLERRGHTYCLTAAPKTRRSRKISPRPRKISRTEQNVAEVRSKIIESARDLFVERGFHHTSVDDIAAKAGVSRATCYYQFNSKPGILDAVIADAQQRAPVTLRSRIRQPATLPKPADNLWGLIHDICQIWEQDRPLYRRVIPLGQIDPEMREVIEGREQERSVAIDAISHRLIARYQRRATVEALWALTSFPVFDSIRRHTSFEEVVEMLTGMAVTIVDPDKLWELPRPESEQDL